MSDLGAIGKSSLPVILDVNAASLTTPGGSEVLNLRQAANGSSPGPLNFYQSNALAGPATSISGTVTESGVPVARIVRAYSRASGALRGQTTSDAITGHFSIGLSGIGQVFVVALDDTGVAPDYNAKIFDLVVPG